MSILFLLIAAGLTAGVTLLLTLPLLRTKSDSTSGKVDNRLWVYRQQLAELEHDHTAQAITSQHYQEARQELERRVLEETASVPVSSAARWMPSSKSIAVALIATIPLAGFLLYGLLGNPLAFVHPASQMREGGTDNGNAHQSAQGLDALTERLKQRMAQNPGDGVGWALLARSYVELGRHREAVTAFEKSMALVPDDPQLMVDYADALAMTQGRKLEGKPEEMVSRALKLDPTNAKGLMLAGTIAFDKKDYATAIKHWEEAQKGLSPDREAEVMQELAANINETRGLLGLPAKSSPMAGSDPAARSGTVVGSAGGQSITGTVTIAPKLAGKGSPSDTLFVFARAPEGPPMPVAIVRSTKGDLPYSFRLDDSTSPMPTRKLSDAGPVSIVARLSKSGEAMPKSGDLQGVSQPVTPGTQGLTVVIDSELP